MAVVVDSAAWPARLAISHAARAAVVATAATLPVAAACVIARLVTSAGGGWNATMRIAVALTLLAALRVTAAFAVTAVSARPAAPLFAAHLHRRGWAAVAAPALETVGLIGQ